MARFLASNLIGDKTVDCKRFLLVLVVRCRSVAATQGSLVWQNGQERRPSGQGPTSLCAVKQTNN